MEGYLRTEELNNNELEAGKIVVYRREHIVEICTVMHINPEGVWVITGQTFADLAVPVAAELCKLVILTDSNAYPLKFSQWDKAIKNGEVNSDEKVIFKTIPSDKFKEGKYIRVCDVCTANFMASKTQYQCRNCNDADVTAQISKVKEVKTKRPRMKSTIEIKALALTSFQMGSSTPKSTEDLKVFNVWLDKQF
jgi:hypothetical protein